LKLLLDTHIWLWSALTPARLSPRIANELRNLSNEIWVSPISSWEALNLHRKGRLNLGEDVHDWIIEATSRFREAPLTHEIAVIAHEMPLLYWDPADRFLAATAKVLGLTLVTADQRLLGLGTISTLANR